MLKAAPQTVRNPTFAFFLRNLDVRGLAIRFRSGLTSDCSKADEDSEITFGGSCQQAFRSAKQTFQKSEVTLCCRYRKDRLEGEVTWLPVLGRVSSSAASRLQTGRKACEDGHRSQNKRQTKKAIGLSYTY